MSVVLVAAGLFAGAAHARAPGPCATMRHFEAQRTAAALFDTAAGSQRPTNAPSQVESAAHPLVVHYGAGVDAARAAQVLGIFDDAWEQQVTGAGFPPPPADGAEGGDARFDVYVIPLDPGLGGITLAEGDRDATDNRRASTSFIEIDPTLPDDLLEVYSHHEFQHALQFGIDTEEPVMWYEATAVYWEVRTRPDVDDWLAGLPDFQSNPTMPIFADSLVVDEFGAAPVERYEYGAVLFALYLDEVHGDGAGTVLREIWDGTAEPDREVKNRPSFLDAATAVGIDVPGVLPDFAGWRALVGPLSRPDDGPRESIPGAARLVAQELNAQTLDGTLRTTADIDSPLPLGCAIREVTAPANVDEMPVSIHVEPTLPGQVLALSTIVFDQSAGTLARITGTPSTAPLDASVRVPTNALLQLSVCDVTPAEPDDALAPRPIRLSVLRTDVDFPDAGPPPGDAGPVDVDAGPPPPPPPVGCSCQGAGDPRNMKSGLAALGFLVSMFALGARAVRARRRKAMFRGPTRRPHEDEQKNG